MGGGEYLKKPELSESKVGAGGEPAGGGRCGDRGVAGLASSGGLKENCCELDQLARDGYVQLSSKESTIYHVEVWVGARGGGWGCREEPGSWCSEA